MRKKNISKNFKTFSKKKYFPKKKSFDLRNDFAPMRQLFLK
jgi:hypothetical protein